MRIAPSCSVSLHAYPGLSGVVELFKRVVAGEKAVWKARALFPLSPPPRSRQVDMELPRELAQMVVDSTPPSSLAQLALVSPALHAQTRRALFTSPCLNSSAAAQLFLRSLKQDPTLAQMAESLTLERGSSTKPSSASKRRGAREVEEVEDAVTDVELVQLATALTQLKSIHLREVGFTSLRRRSLSDFTSQLSSLHTLSIAGRPAAPSSHPSDSLFNLHTVGQIVVSLPQLRHLALRHIHASPNSLEGLSPYPTYTLTSFALYSTPNLNPKHLHWLLRSTSFAESLRTLALDWNSSNSSPRIFNPIRYSVLRVERLHLTTSTPGVVENFVLHCPSLTRLTISASVPVDGARLFGNLEMPLLELADRSAGEGNGLDTRLLALIIAGRSLRFARKLRRLSLAPRVESQRRFEELREACAERRVDLDVLNVSLSSTTEPWIPEEYGSPDLFLDADARLTLFLLRFASLRPVELISVEVAGAL